MKKKSFTVLSISCLLIVAVGCASVELIDPPSRPDIIMGDMDSDQYDQVGQVWVARSGVHLLILFGLINIPMTPADVNTASDLLLEDAREMGGDKVINSRYVVRPIPWDLFLFCPIYCFGLPYVSATGMAVREK